MGLCFQYPADAVAAMEQRIDLPPFLHRHAQSGGPARIDGMGSGSMQLPPLSEVLRGVDQSRQAEGPPSAAPREAHGFPEAQSLAPSPGRLRPPYAPSGAYPSESSVSSEYSERRSSYASPSSSASQTSNKGSPVLPPMHAMHPPRGPAPDYNSSRSGLPPLYGGGEHPPARSVPSPPRHTAYPPPYGPAPPPEYVGPYARMSPAHPHAHPHPHAHAHAHAHAPPQPPIPYGHGYDEFGDTKQKRRRGNLPKPVTDILRQWFQDHIAHPYPTEEEKQALMHQTGLTMSQISNWFINARRRSLPQMHRQAQTDGDPRDGTR